MERSADRSATSPADAAVAAAVLVKCIRTELASELAWTDGEPNTEELWARVRRQAEALLYSCWRNGELVGATQEQAFFVRCDRSTMTQNDLDNGRLNLLVGVATVAPAEFTAIQVSRQVSHANRRPRFRFWRRPAH